jgi:hypothetical protein
MTDAKKRPAATIYAIVKPAGRGSEAREQWIPIGVLWRTEEGHLSGELQSEPFDWKQPGAQRKVFVRMVDEQQSRGRR